MSLIKSLLLSIYSVWIFCLPSGEVSITDKSLIPNSDKFRVLGIGVAVKVKISISPLSFF